ncbi:hypothetical protein [Pseudomonas sp. 2(2015)]|uniref:hypothetical protein n=1 Tax=Pseudomonas sp. 2(2015) TaxID=1619950 RepID=UPI0005EAD8CA|nr:hypothetical protein [Pseudomonas sp. 2(2015)]KJK19030.1 hypothetical protein UB48_04500 [Pseudomonas sp. 2(2015)]
MDYDAADAEWVSMLEDALDGFIPHTATHEKAVGIARQVLGQGYSSLSQHQKSVFDSVFSPLLSQQQSARDKARVKELLSRDTPP